MTIRDMNLATASPAAPEEGSAIGEGVNVNTGAGAKKIIETCTNRKTTIQQNRSAFERTWLVNIAFLYGKHYFSIDRASSKSGLEERIAWELKSLERAKKTRRTVNYILPLYRSLLSRLLQMKQSINVEPETRQNRDIAAARVCQEALEDFWKGANKTNPILCQEFAGMMNCMAKLFQYMLIIGRGYLIPRYNPSAKAKVPFLHLPGQPIMEAEIGAVEVEVDHPFNVFPDPQRRFKIQKKIMSIDEIEELYGKRVSAEDVGITDVEKQLMSLLEGGGGDEKYKDSAEILVQWEVPSAKKPQGEFLVCTKSEVLVEPTGIPEEYAGRIPFFEFNYIDILFAHPQGVIEQLVPSQEEYNHTVSRLHEYKKWMTGKILVPDGADLSAKYDDQVGQVIRYNAANGKPEFSTPPGAPSFIMREVERIRREMEDIASVHDASQGRTPAGVKSGQAIENLSELDNSQLSPQLLHVEQQLEFFADTVLNIMQAKYSIQRLIGISGKDMTSDVKTFKGKDVAGNRRIKISLGSTLPHNREARQAVIMSLAEKQYITKERALELLEFGDVDGVYRSLDDAAEKTEVQEMMRGIEVIAMPYENHARRIKILTDFMMGDEYLALRKKANEGSVDALKIVQIFEQHRRQHQEFLSGEMNIINPKPAAAPGAPAA